MKLWNIADIPVNSSVCKAFGIKAAFKDAGGSLSSMAVVWTQFSKDLSGVVFMLN